MTINRSTLLRAFSLVLLATVVAPVFAGETYNKTVGTVPNTCGTEKEITVDPGATVYFCYYFEPSIPNDYEYNLTDDQLGPLDSSFNSTLGSGPYEFIVSQMVTESVTNVGNFSRSYSLSSGNTTRQFPPPTFYLSTARVNVNQTPNGNGSGGGGSGTQFDASIPTLSEVSMFVFGGLLLLGAAITLRRTSG